MSRADDLRCGDYPIHDLHAYAKELEARVATIEAETREACAVVAWSHYMETCQRTATPPSTPYRWSAAAAIRAMQPASNTRDAGPTPFAGRTTRRD